MTTIANNVATKISVSIVAVALAFTAFAPAQAQTTESLQQMINDLLAQVAQLQAGVGATTGGSCVSIAAPLTIGAQNADVTALQNRLLADGQTIPAGATGYFGGQTQAALAGWQAANGVAPAVGYYGPITKAAMDASCVPATTGGDDDMDDDDMMDDDDDDSSDNSPLSGDADLEDFEIDDPSDDDIDEGAEDQEIAEFTIQFENGDAEIDRLEISVLAEGETDTSTIEPWDVFETLSLWVDGDKVAEEDVDDEDDWLDEDAGTFRFRGLELIARENDDLVIILAASIQNGLDTTPAEIGGWFVTAEEMRFFDADGVSDDDSTTDDLGGPDTSTFDIQEEGDEDELFIRSSTNDPDSTTFELEDDDNSGWETIFTFDLDTEDSTNDITMEGLQVDVAATEDGTLATSTLFLIDDVQLVVNGEVYDDVTITHGTPGTFLFDLDDEDWDIEAGDRVEVEFQVEFEALTALFEGATVEASTDSSVGLAAEGPENLTGSQLSGASTGELHTLRTEGAILAPDSESETLKINDDQDLTDDEGVFVISFDVTAFESDLFVNKTAASGTTMGTAGANFLVEDNAGNPVAAGTSSASLTSTADTDGTNFRVDEGETETFTLTVEYDPAAPGFFQLQLYSLNFAVAAGNPTTQQRALEESDYETDALSI